MPSVWSIYTAAPHRVLFLGGMVQILLAVGWWCVELWLRLAGTGGAAETAFHATWAHAWVMLFGLFPFFMFGFLMTTYPRWMAGPEVPRRDYVGAFLLLFSGVVLFYPGLYIGIGVLAVAGVLHVAGVGWAAVALHRVFRAAGASRDRRYESQLNVALMLGIAAEVTFLVGMVSGEARLQQGALSAGLWLFLVPMLVLVAHRMIPFFSRAVLSGYVAVQPWWSFPLLWSAVSLHFSLEVLGARELVWLADGPLLLLALHHSFHWQWRRALAVRLLGALHVAFGFLSLAMVLSVLQSLWLFATGELLLFRAALHAIGIGFVGGMTVAMVTRVSRGHSGRPLEMDRRDTLAFGAIVLATLVRIAAEVVPLAGWNPLSFSLAAGLVWIGGVVPWAARYSLAYLQPRVDGQPG